jgi:tetratricopeptide (TPR) repeat protein
LLPVAAVAALLGGCWYWNPVFDDAMSLWRHNVALAPELPFPHYQAAYFLNQKQIWTQRGANDTGAIEEYELALRLNDALLARGEEGMPPDQLARAYLSLGEIYLDELPESRRDYQKAKDDLKRAIAVGTATQQLDAELGKALYCFARLRHVGSAGVSRDQARTALRAALELQLSPALRAGVEEDLARLEKEPDVKPAPAGH